MQLFRAGIELGMRYYYRSDPDHIRIDTYKEYNITTQHFDNYLVMYDTVPGGTGYLAKLYNTVEFTRLLNVAYEHIRDCECQHEGKDGCYHCILSYGNQYQREGMSRERAEELFGRIVKQSDDWEEIDGSLGTLAQGGVIEDSELELLFVACLRQLVKRDHLGWRFERKFDLDTYYYELEMIEDGSMDVVYTIRPQYPLGPANGVAHHTVPDFQFICSKAVVGGRELNVLEIPQWSVFMDGYEFHASQEHMRFYGDIQKREDIRQAQGTGHMLTWTLTWEDMIYYMNEDGAMQSDRYFRENPPSDIGEEFSENQFRQCRTSFERFVAALKMLHPETMQREAFMNVGYWTLSNNDYCSYDNVASSLEAGAPVGTLSQADMEAEHMFVKSGILEPNMLTQGSVWFAYDCEDDYSQSVRYSWKMIEGLPVIEKTDWEDFWRLYDMLQFFDTRVVDDGQMSAESLDDILIYYPGLEDIVRQLVERNIPFSHEGGFAVQDEDGMILAEADLGFDDSKIVINPFSDDDRIWFEANGYTVVSPEDFNVELLIQK